MQTCASCVPPASRPLRLRRALAAQRLRCRRAGARLRIGYPARGRYGGPGRLHAVATRARIGPRSWLVFTHRVLALQHLWPSPRSVNPPRPALCASATLRFKRQLVPAVLRSRSRPPPSPRTKWTRRIPHPVLIGHAASLTPYKSDTHGRGSTFLILLSTQDSSCLNSAAVRPPPSPSACLHWESLSFDLVAFGPGGLIHGRGLGLHGPPRPAMRHCSA